MVQLREASAGDEALIVSTSRQAFRADPQLRYVIDDDARWDGEAGDAFFGVAAAWFAGIGTRTVTDDVVSICLWAMPDHREPPAETLITLGTLNERLTPAEQARASILVESFNAHKPDEPFVYVGVLATHPDWQRRGLGRLLMAPALAAADAAGIGTYLETGTAANVAFYRGCGFEVRAEWDVADGPHNWGLWRPPG